MRAQTPRCERARPARALVGWLTFAAFLVPSVAAADDGGAALPPTPSQPTQTGAPATGLPPASVPGAVAKLSADRRTAFPPAVAPEPVKQAIYAANEITRAPYVYGGGHGRFRSRGYDCSGAVSYVLHGAEFLASPMDSTEFMRWGEPGRGAWITVYTNPGHAYVVIAGLRFDTSGPGERGPRWRPGTRSGKSFRARHPVEF